MIRAGSFLGRLVKAFAAEPGSTPLGHGRSLARRFIVALACRPPRS
ncbi:hypothetical protein ABZX95_20560 [Streptomyces sp. NPDC004232]|nr:hypothetical protein [Streptomyces sp. tea 10]